MKYLLIYFYIAQVCAPVGSPISAPPYFYMMSFDTYEEARKKEIILESDGAEAVIVMGVPGFSVGEEPAQ